MVGQRRHSSFELKKNEKYLVVSGQEQHTIKTHN